jgi:hypothetical protein
MRGFLVDHFRRWSPAAFWLSVLFVLPNCTLERGGLGPFTNLYKGYPQNDLIRCDIEKPDGRHCSTAEERARGIRLSEAAIALVEGRSSDVGLDDSAAALAACGGQPQAVYFQGPFPQGFSVCLNCAGVIGIPSQPDVTAACQKQCLDFFGTTDSDGSFQPNLSPDMATINFCNAVSKPSTNTANDTCFLGACTDGAESASFIDPRRNTEPVIWADLIGVATGGADGNDLTRTAATTMTFDAGAVSQQWITKGDAYVEFSASSNDKTHLLGLTSIPGCAPPCTDTDPGFASIGFAFSLGNDSLVYILESGTILTNPVGGGSTWGTYSVGERFRIRVRDNGNNTATISYARVTGACTPGTVCAQETIHTHVGTVQYPLRVDTSSFEQNATLVNVRLARIK